ncbi:zinc-finger domain-containing protein [Paenibacillus sp. FSL M7-0547]|uniref:zinc-finger domain-containing protein n=1 Tax=Paenibacillus sp. FSL M7-0547 TaxID=2954755 RepID=UPI0030F7421B
MDRKQAIQQMDKHLEVCKTCPNKLDKRWSHPSYNRLQSICNNECPTGRELRKVAEDLEHIVREKRKKKGMIA